jgi:hypothetical protein
VQIGLIDLDTPREQFTHVKKRLLIWKPRLMLHLYDGGRGIVG